jgi:hypothetical protein
MLHLRYRNTKQLFLHSATLFNGSHLLYVEESPSIIRDVPGVKDSPCPGRRAIAVAFTAVSNTSKSYKRKKYLPQSDFTESHNPNLWRLAKQQLSDFSFRRTIKLYIYGLYFLNQFSTSLSPTHRQRQVYGHSR